MSVALLIFVGFDLKQNPDVIADAGRRIQAEVTALDGGSAIGAALQFFVDRMRSAFERSDD
jgi:hypothetical protein